MHIFSIETSCDETSVALFNTASGQLIQRIHSQIPLHNQHGGVVPELAARSHLRMLPLLTKELMVEAGLSYHGIDAIAYTRGPGLVAPLLIGASFAKSLAGRLARPCYGVHHLEAHMCIAMHEAKNLTFPFVCLLVSGGHTLLIFARMLGDYQILGQTLDDASGEAFDKCGKMMGLDYPAGMHIDRLAKQAHSNNALPPLPRPLLQRQGYDFSFSGVKTAFKQLYCEYHETVSINHYCQRIQATIVDHLLRQIKRFYRDTQCKLPLVLAGGVAANHYLRNRMHCWAESKGITLHYPSLCYCTDNAAMVAYTCALQLREGAEKCYDDVLPRWPLDQLNA